MATLQQALDAMTAAIRPAIPGGVAAIVYSGWPTQRDLKSAPDAGYPLASTVHVNVYPMPGGRNTTRFARQTAYPATTTALATVVSGNAVTLTGAISTGPGGADIGATIGLRIQQFAPVRYTVAQGDGLPGIATALAAAVNGAAYPGVTATAAGSTVTASKGPVTVAVGPAATAITPIGQRQQEVMVTVWAPTPALRDSVADAVDLALGGLDRLALSDFPARLTYERTWEEEPQFDAPAYRRSLFYIVEWFLTQSDPATAIVAPGLTIGPLS